MRRNEEDNELLGYAHVPAGEQAARKVPHHEPPETPSFFDPMGNPTDVPPLDRSREAPKAKAENDPA